MRYDSSAEMTTGRIKATREEPTGSLRNAAIVFVLSLGSGFTVYIGVALIGWGAGWDSAPAKIASGIAVLVVWGWFLFQYVPDLLWTIERVTKRDIDRDGLIGPPSYVSYDLPLSRNTLIRGELPIDGKLLRDWCMAAQRGNSLSYDAWKSRFSLPQGSNGRARYNAFRQALVEQGLALESGGNVGLELTGRGRMFVDSFIEGDEGTPLLDAHHDSAMGQDTYTRT
jgi:hypothetical protein